jgi:MFS transporter, PPP family, 3-phenylpropionic acid transporter
MAGMSPRPPLVERRTAITGMMVLFGVCIAAFFPFLALFLQQHGLDPSEIGLAVGAMALGRVLFTSAWGHVADAVLGRRDTLRISLLGTVVAGTALSLAGQSLPAVLITSFLLAAVSCATVPSIDAIALESLGHEHISEYGGIRAWMSAGYAVANLVLGLVLQAVGARWSVPIYTAVSAVLLLWTLTLRRDPPPHTGESGRFGAVGDAFRHAPRFVWFLLAELFLWIGFSGAWNFLALRIEGAGGGPLLVGLGAALGGVAEVVVMRGSSRLSERIGLRGVFAAGCLVYGTGFLLWGVVNNALAISLLTVLEGTGFGLLFTSGVVIVGRLLPSSLYATGQSIANTVAFGIGPIIGGTLGGWIYQDVGPLALYAGSSALAVTAAVIAWRTLSAPAFTRPQRIETPVAIPPDPAVGA